MPRRDRLPGEAREPEQQVGGAVGLLLRREGPGNPDVRRTAETPECRRHDSDDDERNGVEIDRLPKDVRRAPETRPPEGIAHDGRAPGFASVDHRPAGRSVVIARERSAHERSDAEHTEVVLENELHRDEMRLRLPSDLSLERPGRGGRLKAVIPRLQVEEVRRTKRTSRAASGMGLGGHYQTIGLGIGKRAKERGIEEGEHGDREAHGERHQENHEPRVKGCFQKATDALTEIVPQEVHGSPRFRFGPIVPLLCPCHLARLA